MSRGTVLRKAEDSSVRGISTPKYVERAALVLVIVTFGGVASTEDTKHVSDVEALVAQLKEQVAERDSAWYGRVETTIEKLVSYGEQALPVVAQALRVEKDLEVAAYLARVLAQMPSEKSHRALIALHTEMPTLRASIEGGLRKGLVERGGAIVFRLSETQMQAFLARIEEGYGSSVADVLGVCQQNDLTLVAETMVRQFIRQVGEPSPSVSPSSFPSYLSPYVLPLYQYLRGFEALGIRAAPVLKRAKKTSHDGDIDKWLALALGYAGDADVTDQLTHVVKEDPDPYVRCVAIEAYARSAKAEAGPVLESLLEDETVSEYGGNRWPILHEAAGRMLNALSSGEIK